MPAQLDYAQRPTMVRRRRFRQAVVGIIVSCVVASAGWWGPPAWRRARLLYLQRQCLRYVAPSDQLICAEPLPYGGQTPPFASSVPDPACLLSFGPPLVLPP